MSFSSGARGVVDSIRSLGPEAQREKKWANEKRSMERGMFASQMKKNRAANEKARLESDLLAAKTAGMEKYDAAVLMQSSIEKYIATPGLDKMSAGDRALLLEQHASEFESPEAQQAFKAAAKAGDFRSLDKELDGMAAGLNRNFDAGIERAEKGWYETPNGDIEYIRKSSALAKQPAADWQVQLKQAGENGEGLDNDTQIVDNRLVYKSGPKQGTSEPISGLTETEQEDLNTAEVNLAWKRIAATGKIGSGFSKLTKTHMQGVTQEDAIAREEVGKAGIHELKARPTQSQNAKINAAWQEIDTHIENLESMLVDIEADPTLAGVPGSLRKGAQTTLGVMEDLLRYAPVIGPVLDMAEALTDDMSSEDKERFGHDPKLSRLRIFENDLAWALARARQPEGRILAKNYEAATKDAKITGVTSSRDVVARIGEIVRLLKQNKANKVEISRGEGATTGVKTEYTWDEL